MNTTLPYPNRLSSAASVIALVVSMIMSPCWTPLARASHGNGDSPSGELIASKIDNELLMQGVNGTSPTIVSNSVTDPGTRITSSFATALQINTALQNAADEFPGD